MRRQKQGFTLVEVMVVLVIIAILAAVSIPSFSGFVAKAKENQYIFEGKMVCNAVQAYLIEEYAKGTLEHIKVYDDIQAYGLDNPKNSIYSYVESDITPGAYIGGIGIAEENAQLTWLSYVVDEYEVEFYPGEEVQITKIR